MVRARGQAESYARALPDEYPPFLVTVAVGQEIQLFADFSRTGKNYQPSLGRGGRRCGRSNCDDGGRHRNPRR